MTWKKTYDGDEPVRVNKWLAQHGVCSRREAETLIAEGQVLIDGEQVEDVGRKISAGQTLTLERAGAQKLESQQTYVLNKPVGYVSSQPEKGQTTAVKLLNRSNCEDGSLAPKKSAKLAPLGRLDQDSRGLLLLSEDGALAKAVIGPDSRIDKEYLVRFEGELNNRKLALLRHGLTLDGKPLKPAKVRHEADDTLRFVLTEGRNRQIRRMCAAVGLRVVDLLRLRIGPVHLGALEEGRWRLLRADERAALLKG